jgi:hypothetical protein
MLAVAASRKVERIHPDSDYLVAFAAFSNSFTSASCRRIGTILALTCPFASGGRPRFLVAVFLVLIVVYAFPVVLNDDALTASSLAKLQAEGAGCYFPSRLVCPVCIVRPSVDAICFRQMEIEDLYFTFPHGLPLKDFFDGHGFNVSRVPYGKGDGSRPLVPLCSLRSCR